MKFTGERYLPTEGGDIRHEHMHRYAWCRQLAVGADVLDIACGEGYGSAMLARVARSVKGVDISTEAVENAQSVYGSQRDLEFIVGSAAQIPLSDQSIDLAVSFETIEHHDQHDQMLAEIRRVLRPGGLLVISSPNRVIYSEHAGYHNEFHVKELDYKEFDSVLRKQFDNIRYFGQRLAVGSSIFSLRDTESGKEVKAFTDTGEEIVERASSLVDPVYFIAIAGARNVDVRSLLQPSIFFSEAEDLYTHHREVAKWAKQLDGELLALRTQYAEVVASGEKVSRWAQSLEQDLAGRTQKLVEIRVALADRERDVAALRADMKDAQEEVVRRVARTLELTEWAKRLDGELLALRTMYAEVVASGENVSRWAQSLEQDLAERTTGLADVTAALAVRDQDLVEAKGALALAQAVSERAADAARHEAGVLRAARVEAQGEIVKRDARITVLERVKSELELIKSSRSWRLTKPLRFVLRVMRNRGIGVEDRRQLVRLWRARRSDAGSVSATPAIIDGTNASAAAISCSPVGVKLAPAELNGRRDFFFWAVIDWHFRIQRPQHLARELAAAGHRVFYMSNNFIDCSDAGFSVEPLDDDGRLFQVHLHLEGSPAIYGAAPDASATAQLQAGIGMLLAWARSSACASIIQHPYWSKVAQVLPNQRIIYDCMDHHGGFSNNGDGVLEREHELMRDADLLVVTSDWLYDEAGKYNAQRLMVRNACQYDHFSSAPKDVYLDPRGRKIIGYYGAIAEWFDLDLIEKVAKRFSDCLVLLVGADTCGAKSRLEALGNVEFTGEVPYAVLPHYLYAFDVCLLPFQIIPLTLATNPVKVYEYLSAGKPVVSVDLPEIRQFGNLVRVVDDHAAFLDAVAQAIRVKSTSAEIAQRRRFASGQTWAHRVRDLTAGIEAILEPRTSVVVVTYNNLEVTKACLSSLELYSDYKNLEIIVVDNASADETPSYLAEWAAGGKDRHIILNSDNRGFAAANNQGLAVATGEYLVMLNNDTYVTPGWLATLVQHLRRSPKLGMLGPVTNNIGNEARIDIQYPDMEGMLQTAGDYTRLHVGQLTPLRTAAFFCVMLSRSVYERVGPLDEVFGIGFFEDDDYCRRVEEAGWSIACADDVFIHHHLSASFNKLKQETRQALFERNKIVYEAKWGKWIPHGYRSCG